jgi:hypothetical protein
VVITRTDTDATPGVAIWGGAPRSGSLEAAVDGSQVPLTAAVRLEYDPRPLWVEHVQTIAARMADYGPAWGGASVFVALLMVLVVAVVAALSLGNRRAALIAVVVVAALARGLLWSAAVPAFSAMDEPAHFSNVQYIAEEHAVPVSGDGRAPYSPQIETAIDRLNINASAPGDRADYSAAGEQATIAAIDAASPMGGGGGPAASYSPVYYAPAALFVGLVHGDFFDSVMAARMWSVLLGVAAAVLLLLIGAELFPASTLAQALFGVAGVLQPMAAHQFAIVNNDAWVIVAGFAAFLVALKLTSRGRAPVLSLVAGLLIGAALMGKPFGVAVAVPLAVGWLVGKVRDRRWTWRGLLVEVLLVVAGVILTYGTWRLYLVAHHIPPQALPTGDGGLRSKRRFLVENFSPTALTLMWGSQMWGNFGWVRIPFQEPVPELLALCGGLVVLGIAVWAALRVVVLFRRLRAPRDAVSEVVSPAAGPSAGPIDVRLTVTAASLAGIGVSLYAAGWMYYLSTGHNDLLQGRYALLALPAVLAAPALLLERVRGHRAATITLLCLAAGMAALTMLGLRNTLEAFYG